MMEAVIFPAFPTLIQKFKFEGDNEHLQNVILGISKFEDVDPHLSGYNFLEKYKDSYKIIDEFLTFSQKSAETFFSNTLRYKRERMVCVNSWVNTLRSLDDYLPPHFHTNSFVSSNYFLSYTHGKHAPLVFLNSDRASTIPCLVHDKEDDNGDTAILEYSEGDLVFWRSELTHFVPKSSELGRVTIAQNYMPEVINTGGYSFKSAPVNNSTKHFLDGLLDGSKTY